MARLPHPNRRPLESLPVELRRCGVPAGVRAWVRGALGSEVRNVRRLPGASSTAVHRLVLADGRIVVLRRYAWRGFLDDEPDAPVREVDALAFASRHGLPVPSVVAADADGSTIGDGIPALVMTFVPGRPVARPDLHALAELAASVHDVDPSGFPHAYFPWYRDAFVAPPRDATDPALWARAIGIWHAHVPRFEPRFVHRDFHPGNVLWHRGAAHLVDWANACAGPWGCDVAHCRDNLTQLAGAEVADAFLGEYVAITGAEYDPYWEIASVLEHSPSDFAPEDVRLGEARLRPAVGAYSA